MKNDTPNSSSLVSRVSTTNAVVDYIREQIRTGIFPSGEKLPTEASLCDTLGVSRTSVREAIRVLQALDAVTLVPGKGAFVADHKEPSVTKRNNLYIIDNAKFRDFMEVRMAIETLAIRLAVERATPQQINELERIHISFLYANEVHDSMQLIMLDEQFHTKIIECAGNPLLINMNRQLLEAFHIYRGNSFIDNEVYKNAIIPHSRILLCFQTHNVNQAVEEMRKHLEITLQDMEMICNQQKSSATSSSGS